MFGFYCLIIGIGTVMLIACDCARVIYRQIEAGANLQAVDRGNDRSGGVESFCASYFEVDLHLRRVLRPIEKCARDDTIKRIGYA